MAQRIKFSPGCSRCCTADESSGSSSGGEETPTDCEIYNSPLSVMTLADWSQTGSWAIGSGFSLGWFPSSFAARSSSDGAKLINTAVTVDTAEIMYACRLALSDYSSTRVTRILFAYVDSSNHYWVEITWGTGGFLKIGKKVSGTNTTLSSKSVNYTEAKQFRICIRGTSISLNVLDDDLSSGYSYESIFATFDGTSLGAFGVEYMLTAGGTTLYYELNNCAWVATGPSGAPVQRTWSALTPGATCNVCGGRGDCTFCDGGIRAGTALLTIEGLTRPDANIPATKCLGGQADFGGCCDGTSYEILCTTALGLGPGDDSVGCYWQGPGVCTPFGYIPPTADPYFTSPKTYEPLTFLGVVDVGGGNYKITANLLVRIRCPATIFNPNFIFITSWSLTLDHKPDCCTGGYDLTWNGPATSEDDDQLRNVCLICFGASGTSTPDPFYRFCTGQFATCHVQFQECTNPDD